MTEAAGRFNASGVVWMSQARCAGDAFDFIPFTERDEDLVHVRSVCEPCGVRAECLAYALLYHLHGYWGGTSTSERRLLGYARNRVKCPVCKCKTLVRTDTHEICQSCGLSWTRASLEGEPDERREGAESAGAPDPG